MTIGEFINKRRLALNITLDEIGEAVGVGKSTVKKWETGYISNMKRDKIDKLAKVLQVKPPLVLWMKSLRLRKCKTNSLRRGKSYSIYPQKPLKRT